MFNYSLFTRELIILFICLAPEAEEVAFLFPFYIHPSVHSNFTNLPQLNSHYSFFLSENLKKKMLLKSIISAFKMEEDTKESKNRYPHASSSNEGTVIVGLKILAQISQSRSNVVVKPALVSTRSDSRRRPSASGDQYYCYLKSCYLCNKNLSLDKEVYMYR